MTRATVAGVAVGLVSTVVAAFGIASGGVYAAVYPLGWLVFAVVGALLIARQPRNVIGRLFAVMGLASLLGFAVEIQDPALIVARGTVVSEILVLVSAFWFLAFSLLPALLILFPDGRPPSPRWRIPLWLIAVNVPIGLGSSGQEPMAAPLGPALAAALGIETALAVIDAMQGIASMSMLALFVVAAAAIVVRWRGSTGVERQQLKWIAFSGVLLALMLVGTFVIFFSPLRELDPEAPFAVAMFAGIPFVLALVSLPIAAGIAILRYRLYEIDVLINRALVYGAVSATLAVTYFAGLVLLQRVFSPLTQGSDIAVAFSTLAVAALFQPVRARAQRFVDRRFYRYRYDASKTIEAFAARLRQEVDLDEMRSELVSVVRQTVQPAHVSLWLREVRR